MMIVWVEEAAGASPHGGGKAGAPSEERCTVSRTTIRETGAIQALVLVAV